jgi:hypothetical protein
MESGQVTDGQRIEDSNLTADAIINVGRVTIGCGLLGGAPDTRNRPWRSRVPCLGREVWSDISFYRGT